MGTKPILDWENGIFKFEGSSQHLNDMIAGQTFKWKDPNKEKPIKGSRILVNIGDEPIVCWYTKRERFITTLRCKERYCYDKALRVKIHLSPCREDVTDIVIAWMPIPPLHIKSQNI